MGPYYRHRFQPGRKDKLTCTFCGGRKGLKNPNTGGFVHTGVLTTRKGPGIKKGKRK